MKTADFLDALRQRFNLPSDYALAPMLGVTRSQVSKYRTGKDGFDDAGAEYVAELLELDPAYVIACCHAERARSGSQRQTWERIAATFSKAAGIAALAIGSAGTPTPAQAGGDEGSTICIMSNRRRRSGGASSAESRSPFGLLSQLFGRFPALAP